MTSVLEFGVQMFNRCSIGCGCVYSSKSIERSSLIFGKLLGEIELEFLRNSKYLVEFEDRAGIRKKRFGEAEASPLIHASILRSLVSPTALTWRKCLAYLALLRIGSMKKIYKMEEKPFTFSLNN
jgi:hypothetical protein